MELHEMVEMVDDQNSFLAFVEILKKDREESVRQEKNILSDAYSNGMIGWENGTIESFLGAAHAWAIDSDFGASQDLSEANIWKRMAVFLYCGKIYE